MSATFLNSISIIVLALATGFNSYSIARIARRERQR